MPKGTEGPGGNAGALAFPDQVQSDTGAMPLKIPGSGAEPRRSFASCGTARRPGRQVVMSKTGRNAPCPCGSGKKRKKCSCEPGTSALRPVRDARPAPFPRAALASHPWAERQPIADLLDRYFRAVEDDSPHDAEEAAREMLARFPERIDGHERLAEVFGAQGDHALAAKHYRCAAAGMTPAEPNYDPAYVPYLL